MPGPRGKRRFKNDFRILSTGKRHSKEDSFFRPTQFRLLEQVIPVQEKYEELNITGGALLKYVRIFVRCSDDFCIWEEIVFYVRLMVTSNTWLSSPTELAEEHWYRPLSSGTTAVIVSTWLPVETEARSNGIRAPCLNHSTSGSGAPPTKQRRDKESLSVAVILSSGFFRKKGGTGTGRGAGRPKEREKSKG